MNRIFTVTLFCVAQLLANSIQAQLLTGVPTFTQPPTSQIGTITGNTLTVTPFPNGFNVAGQVQITIPTTSFTAGTLVAWEVDYPVDPTYPFNPALFTTTSLLGFSAPPPGAPGSTNGQVYSALSQGSVVLNSSVSSVPMSLVNGVDSPAWNPAITANSTPFAFTGAPGWVLRQRFELDGIYSGPGGIWVIDVPVETFAIPEPSTFFGVGMTVCLALIALRNKRSRNRS